MKWLPENCLEAISLTIVLDPIIFPSYFYMNGIIVSSIVFIISALIVLHSSKIYITMMEMKTKQIDQLIKYFLGQRWRLTYLIVSLVYIIQLIQMYTLYINEFTIDILVQFFALDNSSKYLDLLVIPITFPLIITALICNSTSAFKFGLQLNVVLILTLITIYIFILISSFQSIKKNFDKSLLTKFNLQNLPYFISQNNYSFHFQLYLEELIVFGQKNKITNQRIQQITIFFALIVGLIFGIIGSLIVNDEQIEVVDDESNQLYKMLIFQYITQFPMLIITMKIFIIFNMIFNIGFKFVIFRKNLIKFIVDKKVININQSDINSIIKIIIIVFIIVLNISTENQQYFLFIVSGSVICFFLLYHIPYLLDTSRRNYILTKKLNSFCFESQQQQKLSEKQIYLKFRSLQINENDSILSINQNFQYENQDQEIQTQESINLNSIYFSNQNYDLKMKSSLDQFALKLKYLVGFIIFIHGISFLILGALYID